MIKRIGGFGWLLLAAGCSVADPSPASSASSAGTAAPTEPEASVTTVTSAAPQPAALIPPATPSPPCPSDMIRVGQFCVDRYEAHLELAGPNGAMEVHPYQLRPRPGVRYVAVNREGVYPQGYISRLESESACAAAGKRLCSRSEWQRACKGTAPARRGAAQPCNGGKQHLMTLMFNQPFHYDEHFNSARLNTEPGFLAKTGEYDACTSDVGAHDMVGNLHEWVTDPVTRALIVELESDGIRRQWQPAQVGNATFMGGFYSTSGEHGPGCLFTTIAHEAAYHDYSTGFRCCKDAALASERTAAGATEPSP